MVWPPGIFSALTRLEKNWVEKKKIFHRDPRMTCKIFSSSSFSQIHSIRRLSEDFFPKLEDLLGKIKMKFWTTFLEHDNWIFGIFFIGGIFQIFSLLEKIFFFNVSKSDEGKNFPVMNWADLQHIAFYLRAHLHVAFSQKSIIKGF